LRYGSKEFESPTRSTIPMLSLLLHSRDTFNEIVRQLGMPAEHDLFLEYPVSPLKGQGPPSQTDVMLKSDLGALAIEAKWTEPMYETVDKWLKKGESESNKRQVLEGWLSLLQEHVHEPLHSSDFNESIYQMVHRATSAVATGADSRLAYFLFKPSPDPQAATSDDIAKELSRLWDKLGKPKGFPFSVVEITIEHTAEYEAIRRLPKQQSDTSKAVVAALLDDAPLFRFPSFNIRSAGEDI